MAAEVVERLVLQLDEPQMGAFGHGEIPWQWCISESPAPEHRFQLAP
jgi:hypothetical protein